MTLANCNEASMKSQQLITISGEGFSKPPCTFSKQMFCGGYQVSLVTDPQGGAVGVITFLAPLPCRWCS